MDLRRLRTDLLALCLLALCVFLALCLWSYDPVDPPGRIAFPARQTPLNVCGLYGAQTAYYLHTALGLGSFFLVFSLLMLDLRRSSCGNGPDRSSRAALRHFPWLVRPLHAAATVCCRIERGQRRGQRRICRRAGTGRVGKALLGGGDHDPNRDLRRRRPVDCRRVVAGLAGVCDPVPAVPVDWPHLPPPSGRTRRRMS